jgi:hypothetical protein
MKENFKINLQLFSEENQEVVQEVLNEEPKEEANTSVELNADVVEKWLQTNEGKKFLQPKLDSYFSKGLESWKNNNLEKLINAEKTQIEEQFKSTISELENKVKITEKKTALEKGLLSNGLNPKYVDLVTKAYDIAEIEDINQAVEKAKNDYSDLFKTTTAKNTFTGNSKPITEDNDDPFTKGLKKAFKL